MMEKEISKVCIKCHADKPIKEFYAKNKTGWSKYCTACRKKRQQKVEKQRIRKYHEIQSKAVEEINALKEKRLAGKIKQLQKEFNRFTLINRNRLQVLLRKCESRTELVERTNKAIASRRLAQERAQALLDYQITVVTAGLRPQHISLLWRDRYGTNTRGESQSLD
jgi:Fe2+ transport system protein B